MTGRVIATTSSGKGFVVAVSETDAEREIRVQNAAKRSAARFRLSVGQKRLLAESPRFKKS